MNTKKIRVGVLFGGKSTEHEISLLSAKGIVEALDKNKYESILIHIDKQGIWSIADSSEAIAIVPGRGKESIVVLSSNTTIPLDVVFPLLHGMNGEDGTVQGLLTLCNLPFVGSGVLGSAVGMDKDVMKRLLKQAGLPVGDFIVIHDYNRNLFTYEDCVKKVGLPLFVKPANTGSSVGVAKVKTKEEFISAVEEAFLYDKKILIEEFILGREIECSVLGNKASIKASLPGEIIPSHDFYSYEAKYLDENGAELVVPVVLDEHTQEEIRRLAVEASRVLCVEGMARVDFFLTREGRVVLNEINTIPGFTKISMYPKLWEATNLSYCDLLDRLVQLALENTVVQTPTTLTAKSEK